MVPADEFCLGARLPWCPWLKQWWHPVVTSLTDPSQLCSAAVWEQPLTKGLHWRKCGFGCPKTLVSYNWYALLTLKAWICSRGPKQGAVCAYRVLFVGTLREQPPNLVNCAALGKGGARGITCVSSGSGDMWWSSVGKIWMLYATPENLLKLLKF